MENNKNLCINAFIKLYIILIVFVILILNWPFILIIIIGIIFYLKIDLKALLDQIGILKCLQEYNKKVKDVSNKYYEDIKLKNNQNDKKLITKIDELYPKSKIERPKNVILPEKKEDYLNNDKIIFKDVIKDNVYNNNDFKKDYNIKKVDYKYKNHDYKTDKKEDILDKQSTVFDGRSVFDNYESVSDLFGKK